MLIDARGRLVGGRRSLAVHVPPGRGVGHRVAAAPHAELSGHGGKRQDRGRRRAAVAVPLLPPAAAQRGRARVRVEAREGLDVGGGNARLGGGPLERPLGGPALELSGAGGMRLEKIAIRPALREDPPDDRQSEWQVRPGVGSEMEVRALGEARPAWIHDHEPGALLLRLLDVRDEMDPGNGRIHAPEHDEARVRVVRIRDSGHLAVESGVGRGRRRGADRARQPRRAEPPEEPRVRRALREVAVRAAVGERQDRLPPAAAPDLEELAAKRARGLRPTRRPGNVLRPSARLEGPAGAAAPLRTCGAGTRAPWRRCSRG